MEKYLFMSIQDNQVWNHPKNKQGLAWAKVTELLKASEAHGHLFQLLNERNTKDHYNGARKKFLASENCKIWQSGADDESTDEVDRILWGIIELENAAASKAEEATQRKKQDEENLEDGFQDLRKASMGFKAAHPPKPIASKPDVASIFGELVALKKSEMGLTAEKPIKKDGSHLDMEAFLVEAKIPPNKRHEILVQLDEAGFYTPNSLVNATIEMLTNSGLKLGVANVLINTTNLFNL